MQDGIVVCDCVFPLTHPSVEAVSISSRMLQRLLNSGGVLVWCVGYAILVGLFMVEKLYKNVSFYIY